MLDVVELWARGSNGLLLHHDYRSNDNNPNSTRCIHNIDQSKNLCELAFVSLNGFYSKEIHCDTISGKQSQSMIAFSLPRANINIDVFIVCYASKSMKVTSQLADFIILTIFSSHYKFTCWTHL